MYTIEKNKTTTFCIYIIYSLWTLMITPTYTHIGVYVVWRVHSPGIGGAKTNTQPKSNTYKCLPLANTLLPLTILHGKECSGPQSDEFRCH